MTQPITYVSNGNMRRFNDNEIDYMAYQLQYAYAQQLNNNGQGRVFVSGSNQGNGVAVDTQRTARSHPSFFPGSGTQTINNYYIGQNRTNQGTVNFWSPLTWNGTALQRDNGLLPEVFSEALSQIRDGNELGSYRVATGSPGTGWVSKGVAHTDTLYGSGQSIPNFINATTNYLWLKTGGVAAPGTSPNSIIWNNNLGAIARAPTGWNQDIIQQWALPNFANWADAYLEYRWSNSDTALRNRGSVTDTRRSGTRNVQFNIDSYVSYPSGAASNIQTYYFEVG